MPEQPSHRLPEEFGGNEWLVDELYEQYQKDKNAVDSKWWPLFESFGAAGSSSSWGNWSIGTNSSCGAGLDWFWALRRDAIGADRTSARTMAAAPVQSSGVKASP